MKINYRYLLAQDEQAKKEAEKRIRQYIGKQEQTSQNTMITELEYGDHVPRWAFLEVLDEMEENREITRTPVTITDQIIQANTKE